jgi:hypothetical protein
LLKNSYRSYSLLPLVSFDFRVTSFPYSKVILFPRFVIVILPQSTFLSSGISYTSLFLGSDYRELSIHQGKSTPCSVPSIQQLYTSLTQFTYLCVPYFVTKVMIFPYTIHIEGYGLQTERHDCPNSRAFPQI